MRMKLVMGFSILILVVCVNALPQEIKHAPALQTCTADLNLWTAQAPGWPSPNAEQVREGTKTLTVKEMQERAVYLSSCSSAYPALNRAKPSDLSPVFTLTMVYDNEIQERLFSFLDRHNLIVKFQLEDEAGKR
jgi:hypothetical protein